MFECSLYGLARKKFEWAGENFRRIEKVYSSGTKKAFVHIDSIRHQGTMPGREIRSSEIIFREPPDRNKQRISIASKITRIPATENTETFLDVLGYKHLISNVVEGSKHLRNGYQVEITRLRSSDDLIDSSEEEAIATESHGIPPDFSRFYMVKVFVETESVNDGEALLENAFQELSGQVSLIKPSLSVF